MAHPEANPLATKYGDATMYCNSYITSSGKRIDRMCFYGPLNPRTLDAVNYPNHVNTSKKEEIKNIPTFFIAGPNSEESLSWKDRVSQRLTSKAGYATVKLFIPAELYTASVDTYISRAEFVGQGFVTLFASDALVIHDCPGLYSLFEFVLAKKLGLPTFTKAICDDGRGWNCGLRKVYFDPQEEVWNSATTRLNIKRIHLGEEVIEDLMTDTTTVLDDLLDERENIFQEFGINIFDLLPKDPTLIAEISSLTYWDYISAYLNRDSSYYDFTCSWLRPRLRQMLGHDYNLLKKREPREMDSRDCWAWIDGKLRLVPIYDFETVSERDATFKNFWYVNRKGNGVLCQLIPGTDRFRTVRGAVWEG